MRRAWELSSMKTLMRKKSMEYVVDPTVGTAASRVKVGRDDTKFFHCYSTDLDAIDALLRNNKKFISCVQAGNGRWGIIWKFQSRNYFLTLNLSGLMHTRAGLHYYGWTRELGLQLVPLEEQSVVATGILLPYLQPNLNIGDEGFVSHCYALTSEDHRSLGGLQVLCFT
jgi:hypothetical protein